MVTSPKSYSHHQRRAFILQIHIESFSNLWIRRPLIAAITPRPIPFGVTPRIPTTDQAHSFNFHGSQDAVGVVGNQSAGHLIIEVSHLGSHQIVGLIIGQQYLPVLFHIHPRTRNRLESIVVLDAIITGIVHDLVFGLLDPQRCRSFGHSFAIFVIEEIALIRSITFQFLELDPAEWSLNFFEGSSNLQSPQSGAGSVGLASHRDALRACDLPNQRPHAQAFELFLRAQKQEQDLKPFWSSKENVVDKMSALFPMNTFWWHTSTECSTSQCLSKPSGAFTATSEVGPGRETVATFQLSIGSTHLGKGFLHQSEKNLTQGGKLFCLGSPLLVFSSALSGIQEQIARE